MCDESLDVRLSSAQCLMLAASTHSSAAAVQLRCHLPLPAGAAAACLWASGPPPQQLTAAPGQLEDCSGAAKRAAHRSTLAARKNAMHSGRLACAMPRMPSCSAAVQLSVSGEDMSSCNESENRGTSSSGSEGMASIATSNQGQIKHSRQPLEGGGATALSTESNPVSGKTG